MADKRDSAFDFYFDKPTNQLWPEQANFGRGKGLKRTCKVGSYKPNKLGLYDMHGNVWEWCDDAKKAAAGASNRVGRGGGWVNDAVGCRAATRGGDPPGVRNDYLGFRLARIPVGKEVVAPPAPPEKKTEALPPTFKNSLGMEFVIVPKGKSWLGGGGGLPGDKEVVIAQDFYLGKYEVTQEEWQKVTGVNPSTFSRTGAGKDAVKGIPDEELKRFPVENVSWDTAQAFIERVNKQVKEAGWVYRLPKEAEWEYACRCGPGDKLDSAFDFYFDKPTNQLLPEQANFEHGKGLKRACKVGSYKPNKLGLYDMHGNVAEWCDDAEKAAAGGSSRVLRGGGWSHGAGGCTASARGRLEPGGRSNVLGFRVLAVPSGAK